MSQKRLCIGIPSNRPIAASRATIKSAVDFSLLHGVQLAVSDNSGSDEKKSELSRLVTGADTKYLPRPPCGMMENWFEAFNATDGDFILMMGDDDKIFSIGSQIDMDGLEDDVVGVRPTIQAFLDPRGITNVNFSPIQSLSATDRIIEHLKTSNGSNTGIFSFWRRDVFKSIMELHFFAHPTKGTYADWALMNGLVSSGRVVKNPMACYFYDIKNWAGDAAFISSQVAKAFVASGLPAEASVYSTVLNAIDSFIYVNRSASPLSREERVSTALFCFNFLLENYSKKIPAQSAHENAKELSALSHRLIGNKNATSLFDITLAMLGQIQPDLDRKYKEFFKEATGHDWGQV